MSTVRQILHVAFPGGAINLTGHLDLDAGEHIVGYASEANTLSFDIPVNRKGTGGTVTAQCDGSKPRSERCVVSQVPGDGVTLLFDLTLSLEPSVAPFPSAPSRDEKGLSKLHFGGVWWTHSVYGKMPLFEACFMWLSAEDRQNLYTAKKAVGDRHLLVEVPSGVPLYDEPNQPYSADRFGALGYDGAALIANVSEAVREGFIPILFMNEDYDTSLAAVQVVINDLQSAKVDLVPYCIFSPGWDGIFYGWEPSHTLIPHWGATARATYKGDQANLMLFLEFNPGHIPLGEGDQDYRPGGDMRDFDIVAGEFSPWLHYGVVAGDEVWQVTPRMGCPNGYHRPPEQPADDDPNPPPYVLHDCDRGRRYGWIFETGVFEFVHFGADEFFVPQRAYYAQLGAENVC